MESAAGSVTGTLPPVEGGRDPEHALRDRDCRPRSDAGSNLAASLMRGAFQSLPTAKVFPLMISSSVARFIFRIQYPVPRAHATCLSAVYVYVTLPIGTRRLVVKIEGRPSERRMFDLTGGSGALTPALLGGRLFVEKRGKVKFLIGRERREN